MDRVLLGSQSQATFSGHFSVHFVVATVGRSVRLAYVRLTKPGGEVRCWNISEVSRRWDFPDQKRTIKHGREVRSK